MDGLSTDVRGSRDDMSQQMSTLLGEIEKIHAVENCNALVQVLNSWFVKQKESKERRQCIRALYYPQIGYRKDEAANAHDKTFRWILDDTKDKPLAPPAENRFRDWLQSVDSTRNIFSVSGKLGSGKSTLMNYLLHRGTN